MAVLPVGPLETYTTIAAAESAAVSGADTIELRADITESGFTTSKALDWTSDAGNKWKWTINSGVFTLSTTAANGVSNFSDLHLLNTTGGNWVVDITGTTANLEGQTFKNCTFERTSGGGGVQPRATYNAGSFCTFDQCDFMGGSSGTEGLKSGSNTASVFEVLNCIFSNWGLSGIRWSGSASSSIAKVYNCTFYNKGASDIGIKSSSKTTIRNCAFDNTDDLSMSGNGAETDCQYCAFTEHPSFTGTGNVFSGVGTDWWTAPASDDFTVKNDSSDLYDAGTDLSPDVTDDIIGTSRPQGSAYDIGAYELIVSAVKIINQAVWL